MSTLLTVGNSEGERRCDAKCYGATGDKCDCVCGGANHGKGLERATANVRELAKDALRNMGERGEVVAAQMGLEL